MRISVGVLIAFVAMSIIPSFGQATMWGIEAEQIEYRTHGAVHSVVWDFDAVYGTDTLRVVWRSEAEYAIAETAFEKAENQVRLQTPLSSFFDAVVGIRYDSADPSEQQHGLIGIHGLSSYGFEIDADLFLAAHPFARFEIEHDLLLTNWTILTPSLEVEWSLLDNRSVAGGTLPPEVKIGARVSYDLWHRMVSPYLGVHYHRTFDTIREHGFADVRGIQNAVFLVAGARVLF